MRDGTRLPCVSGAATRGIRAVMLRQHIDHVCRVGNRVCEHIIDSLTYNLKEKVTILFSILHLSLILYFNLFFRFDDYLAIYFPIFELIGTSITPTPISTPNSRRYSQKHAEYLGASRIGTYAKHVHAERAVIRRKSLVFRGHRRPASPPATFSLRNSSCPLNL